MKEFQLNYVMEILDCFYFLIYEHYDVDSVSMGMRAYPSVSFKNHRSGISVSISGSDIGCDWKPYYVSIGKRKIFSLEVIHVTEMMEKMEEYNNREISLKDHSVYLQEHLMPVIRGEQSIPDFLRESQ